MVATKPTPRGATLKGAPSAGNQAAKIKRRLRQTLAAKTKSLPAAK